MNLTRETRLIAGIALAALLFGARLGAQSLPLPPRPADAPSGSEVVRILAQMPLEHREAWIWSEVFSGNVPSWNRGFRQLSFAQPLGGSNYTVTLKALPDYLSLGSDSNYFLCPMTPLLGQRIADRLGCVLPTRKMVNLIWTNSSVKLNPQPISASDRMTTVPVFAVHNGMVRTQRDQHTNTHPPGAMVSGHKKDVVISAKIYTNFSTAAQKPVVIYGWHYPTGGPIQPLYNGHSETWADYSHGIRLIHSQAVINGTAMDITNVLTNPEVARLLHDEGMAEGATNGIIPIPNYRRPGAAPVILKPPRSVSTLPGETLSLSAPASGDDPLHYEWRLNGVVQQTGASPGLLRTNVSDAFQGAWLSRMPQGLPPAGSRWCG
jgi:hypothetical protein